MTDPIPERVYHDFQALAPCSRETSLWIGLHQDRWPEVWDWLDFDIRHYLPAGLYTARQLHTIHERACNDCCGTEFRLKLYQAANQGVILLPTVKITTEMATPPGGQTKKWWVGERVDFFQAVYTCNHQFHLVKEKMEVR